LIKVRTARSDAKVLNNEEHSINILKAGCERIEKYQVYILIISALQVTFRKMESILIKQLLEHIERRLANFY